MPKRVLPVDSIACRVQHRQGVVPSLRLTEKEETDMALARIQGVYATTLSLLICTAATAQAQSSPERLKAFQQRLGVMQQNVNKLPPKVQKALSGGAQNMLAAAQALQHMPPSPDQDKLAALKAALQSRRASVSASYSSGSGPIPVNDPSTDLLYSLFLGMTRSETSTAWCGNSVVAGFNDSGSFLESLFFGPGGLSFSGAGASTDGGNTFKNIGFINPGTNLDTFLGGDPVVNCTNASTFYLSQIASSSDSSGAFTSNVMISKSTDGGFTWGDPISAVSKDAFFYFLDKDWSAIDPNNPNNIYITYTDFDFSQTVCSTVDVAIEIVHSTDGGATWSAPIVVTHNCSFGPAFVQDSQVVVDSYGRVHVEWEEFPDGFDTANRVFRIAKSTDHASSFGPISTIALGFGDGDNFALQGNFRSSITGNLAVDRSGTSSDGDLYLIWEDGRFASRPDVESFTNEYKFGNIVISRSTDGGKTWCPPVRVNNDPLYSSEGMGIDHFQPGVAVNASGKLAACWYDRRDDPFNFNIGRYCGTSTDYGNSWSNVKVDTRTWSPIHDIDLLINPVYLGDYDTVTTDQSKASPGFQGAYGRVDGAFGQDVFDVHVH
jgi:hypothetical protein